MTALPLPLERIAEHIAESLPSDEASEFIDQLAEAAGNGDKDLSRVVWRFLGSMFRRLPKKHRSIDDVPFLGSILRWLPYKNKEIDNVIAGMDLMADGRGCPDALRAADAAGSARAAARAAEAAALTVEAARADRAAEIRAQAADLLRFLREAPGKQLSAPPGHSADMKGEQK